MKLSFAVACLLGLASTQQVVVLEQPQDLPTCIADLEAMLPGVESVIADFKAGNYDKALTDALALLPDAEKAASDCLSSEKKEWLMKIIESLEKVTGVQDLPTCIADLEAMLPGVESVIADFKAGNYDQALTDALALLPDAEKAFTDCTASEPKVGDEAKCIADIEALIPGIEKAIADLKAGKQTAFIIDATILLPKAEAAYKECTSSKKMPKLAYGVKHVIKSLKSGNPEDLPTCIADLEAMIPGVEKVIADFKSGDYNTALTDALTLLPEAEKAYTDCTASEKKFKHHGMKKFENPKDLPTCIADLEAMIPGVEAIIADFKAGNQTKALTDALALLPEAEKAFTECTASVAPMMMHKLGKMKHHLSKINVGDLPTCIADLEAMLPGVESIIADFKAGNYDQALTDAMALLPDAEKAFTDCTASAKSVGGRFKTILKDDPKREYFEKQGAEFAVGFLAGTRVEHFDSIDLYECLHREPKALDVFYHADEEMKYALIKKEYGDAVKAIDEMVYFIVELVKEDYPHTRTEVCKDFQAKDAQWGDLKPILEDLKSQDRTLEVHDTKVFFNKQDITTDAHNILEDYVHGDFQHLGYQLGETFLRASNTTMPIESNLFLY